MWQTDKIDSCSIKNNNNLVIKTLDLHTAGEPLRVIYDGIDNIEADSVLEFRRKMKNKYDHIRTALMWEPRGHADMYGAVLTKPYNKDSDFGVIFMHNEGYSTMCGHGILGIIKLAVSCNLIKLTKPVTKMRIDTPAGIVEAYAEFHDNELIRTYFYNVPSFVYMKNKKVYVDGMGEVVFDIAFGGAFYAYVDANRLNLTLDASNVRKLINVGMKIKKAVCDNFEIKHPIEDDLSFLYGTIFTDGKIIKSRNVCIFADGEVDRSPTGTGVSGRAALHFAKGEISANDKIEIESIIGTKFKGGVVKTVKFNEYDAVIPFVEGKAFITGKSEFVINDEDSLRYGFFMR